MSCATSWATYSLYSPFAIRFQQTLHFQIELKYIKTINKCQEKRLKKDFELKQLVRKGIRDKKHHKMRIIRKKTSKSNKESVLEQLKTSKTKWTNNKEHRSKEYS